MIAIRDESEWAVSVAESHNPACTGISMTQVVDTNPYERQNTILVPGDQLMSKISWVELTLSRFANSV